MRRLVMVMLVGGLVAGCGKPEPKTEPRAPSEVAVMTVAERDTPVTFQYVSQTQSSHQVQIRARVNGFLDKRVYTEGAMVKAGDVMFQQDPKPFQAQLDAAKGALAEQQARLQTANDNLAQVKPLAALNALSQKDLDDATGQQQAAAAAVETAKATLRGRTRNATPRLRRVSLKPCTELENRVSHTNQMYLPHHYFWRGTKNENIESISKAVFRLLEKRNYYTFLSWPM